MCIDSFSLRTAVTWLQACLSCLQQLLVRVSRGDVADILLFRQHVLVQILELDSAWRQRMQKEQVSHLAHTASTRQQRQHSQEERLLHKEHSAAKQVC